MILYNFNWVGINAAGEKKTGVMQATDRLFVKNNLEKNNITVLSIRKSTLLFSHQKKLSQKNKLHFLQQLQLLLQSGIPLSDCLGIIEKTTHDKTIEMISHNINEKIISGVSFSTALSHYPNYFNNTFCQIMSAGENSGELEAALKLLIQNQTHELQIHNQIIKSLFYPCFIMIIAIIISIGLLVFVIPQFSAIYSNFGAQLPIITQYLIFASQNIKKFGCLYFLIMVIIICLSKKLNGFFYCYSFLMRLPKIKSFFLKKEIARWCQLLSMALSSGMPMIDSLHTANQILSDTTLKKNMCSVKEAVIKGQALHAALDLCADFPINAKTMIVIGENADQLPSMIKKVAQYYQEQVNDTLERLSKLIEPVIMLFVSGLISSLIVAMYLPIFKMGSII